MDRGRSTDLRKHQTNSPDWSALIPVLPAEGPRRAALRAELCRLIETRVLLPGQKLPPSRELAQRLALARGAVVAAYEQLAADGYVETRQCEHGVDNQFDCPAPAARHVGESQIHHLLAGNSAP